MTTLKLHHDGWLALPPAFRRALGSGTGDLLEVEAVDGAIVLRPVAKAARKAKAKAAAAPGPEQDATTSSGAVTSLAMTELGAEREPPAVRSRVGDPAPATRRKLGRPREAPAAQQPAPALDLEPEQGLAPFTKESVRSELRRRQTPPAPDLGQPWALVRDPRPARRGPDAHGEREKRPFRQVEVRKLGPGRGHNRSRPRASGAPVPRS